MRDFFVVLIAVLFVGTLTCYDAGAERRLPPDPVNYGSGKQTNKVQKRDFTIFRVTETAYPPDGLDRFRLQGNIEAAKADIAKRGGRPVGIDERLTDKLREGMGQVWKFQPPKR